MAEFRAQARSRGTAAVIDLVGDLTGRSADALMAAHAQALLQGPSVLVLNFTQTVYINSSGIAVIVGILADARRDDLPVRAVGLTDHYRHVFEITRLSDLMTFFVTEEAATAGAAGEAVR